jgi:hypothetical protein
MDLHVFSIPSRPSVKKNLFLECRIAVLCVYVFLVSARTVGRILFIFGVKEIIHHRLASETGALEVGRKI